MRPVEHHAVGLQAQRNIGVFRKIDAPEEFIEQPGCERIAGTGQAHPDREMRRMNEVEHLLLQSPLQLVFRMTRIDRDRTRPARGAAQVAASIVAKIDLVGGRNLGPAMEKYVFQLLAELAGKNIVDVVKLRAAPLKIRTNPCVTEREGAVEHALPDRLAGGRIPDVKYARSGSVGTDVMVADP